MNEITDVVELHVGVVFVQPIEPQFITCGKLIIWCTPV